MKKIFLLIGLSLCTMLYATGVVFMTSSQSLRYVVESDIDKMTFSDSTLLITKNDVSIEICLDSLQKWYFDNNPGEITSVDETSSSNVEIIQVGNVLTVKNLSATNKSVSLCTINGIILQNTQAAESLQIDLSSYVPGIYILNIGKDSFKILNK